MRSAAQYLQRPVTAVSITALVLALAACGGGDETSPESAASRAPGDTSASEGQPPRRIALAYDRVGVSALAVSADGKTVALANSDGRVRLLDPDGAVTPRVLKSAGNVATAGLIFTSDARFLVTVGRDSIAQVWDASSGDIRFTLRGHAQALRTLAASADGSVVATGGEDTRVMVWNGSTGRLQRVLSGHTDFVNSVTVSSDGRWLASGDAAARVLVWNVATGQLVHTLRGHAGEVNAVTFGPDGRLMASTGEDGKVLLWDARSGTQVASFENSGGAMRSLAFSGDGALLAGGAADGRVLVWDTATRRVKEQMAALPGSVNALAFDLRNARRLFVGDPDSAIGVKAMPMTGASTR